MSNLEVDKIPKFNSNHSTRGKWYIRRCFFCNEDITVKEKIQLKILRVENSPHHGKVFCSYNCLIKYCQQQLTKGVIINVSQS